jgi:hypothetical protein
LNTGRVADKGQVKVGFFVEWNSDKKGKYLEWGHCLLNSTGLAPCLVRSSPLVIASEAKQSHFSMKALRFLRRYAPRNDRFLDSTGCGMLI